MARDIRNDDEQEPNYTIQEPDAPHPGEAPDEEEEPTEEEVVEEVAGAPQAWPRVSDYFASARRSLESPVERARIEETVAALQKEHTALRRYQDAAELFSVLVPGCHDYEQKDEAYFFIVRSLQAAPSVGTFSLLTKALLPRVMGLAKAWCKNRHPSEFQEICCRVMAAFAEAALSYPLARLPRKIDVNLYFRTKKLLIRAHKRLCREWVKQRELFGQFEWLVPEAERCAGYGEGDLFETLCKDEERPAPYSEEEKDDVRALLDSLPLKKPISDVERLLLVELSVCRRPEAEVAAELGLPVTTVRMRHYHARERIRKMLPELRNRLNRGGNMKPDRDGGGVPYEGVVQMIEASPDVSTYLCRQRLRAAEAIDGEGPYDDDDAHHRVALLFLLAGEERSVEKLVTATGYPRSFVEKVLERFDAARLSSGESLFVDYDLPGPCLDIIRAVQVGLGLAFKSEDGRTLDMTPRAMANIARHCRRSTTATIAVEGAVAADGAVCGGPRIWEEAVPRIEGALRRRRGTEKIKLRVGAMLILLPARRQFPKPGELLRFVSNDRTAWLKVERVLEKPRRLEVRLLGVTCEWDSAIRALEDLGALLAHSRPLSSTLRWRRGISTARPVNTRH